MKHPKVHDSLNNNGLGSHDQTLHTIYGLPVVTPLSKTSKYVFPLGNSKSKLDVSLKMLLQHVIFSILVSLSAYLFILSHDKERVKFRNNPTNIRSL